MRPSGQKEVRQDHPGLNQGKLARHRWRPLRILMIDDDSADVELCVQELKRAQVSASVEVVQTAAAFSDKLHKRAYDIVLAETAVRDWTGLEALALLRDSGLAIPFILLTNSLKNETASKFMSRGASDCLDKHHLVSLPLAVAIAVERTTVRREQDRVEKELRHSEAHYRALRENPAYGTCRFDVNGRFLEVNEALVLMLGYASKKELMAVNLGTDIIRDPVERAQFETYREKGSVELIEIEWKRKDETAMKVRVSGRRVDQREGEPEGCEIIVEDVTAQRAAEDHLRHLAATDALTSLANYRKLSEALESEIKRSDRTKRAFAVLVFDLNGMKQINDRYGHLAGNRALCRLADIFRFSCRSIDTAARYGGDEFAIVLPETGTKDASQVGMRICERLANDREEPTLSVSFGVAVYPEDGVSIENLLQAADRALYKMKHVAQPAVLIIEKTPGLRTKQREVSRSKPR